MRWLVLVVLAGAMMASSDARAAEGWNGVGIYEIECEARCILFRGPYASMEGCQADAAHDQAEVDSPSYNPDPNDPLSPPKDSKYRCSYFSAEPPSFVFDHD